MKLFERFNKTIEEDFSITFLLKLALLFVIVWLLQATGGFWKGIFSKIWLVVKPFVLGFVIAYILREPIRYGEKHNVPRKVMIALLYVLIGLIAVWLISSLIPMLAERASSLISSLIDSVNWLYSQYEEAGSSQAPDWMDTFVNQSISALSNMKNFLPSIQSLPDLFNGAVKFLANVIVAVVVSIFMSAGWEKVRTGIYHTAGMVSAEFAETVKEINVEESSYIRSLLILVVIHAIEYCLLYLLVGHQDWLIMGLVTGLSLIVPYLGPTIANVIGILTALVLPPSRVITLIVMIVILSNTDEYVLAPLVHAHNTNVTPLWAIFSVFAGGVILGVTGVIIAIPVYLAGRVIYLNYHKKKEEENA